MTKPIQVPEAVWEAFHTSYINALGKGATLEFAIAAALEKYNELLLGDEAVEAAADSELAKEARRALVCGPAWLNPKLRDLQQAAIDSVLGGGDGS